MKIIKDRKIIEDAWHLVGDDEPAGAHAIVSLSRWNSARSELLAGGGPIGVVLRSSESPDDLAARGDVALVAVDFPAFTDGRGYTHARALRTRLGYTGEIRAIGDVTREQMFLMLRCGIDSFAVKPGKSLDNALGAYDDFTVTYQAAADEPRPLFRRVRRSA